MIDDVFNLRRDTVREDAYCRAPTSLHSQLGPIILWVIVPNNANPVTPLHPQIEQPQAECLYVSHGVGPGVLLPDAVFFLTHGDFAVTVLLDPSKQVFWQSVQFNRCGPSCLGTQYSLLN